MTDAERDSTVRAAALYLARIDDYRAFDDVQGFRHGVAHGADLVLQLASNPSVTKAQLDHMLLAVALQVAPDANIAYWAGESDALRGRAVDRAAKAAQHGRVVELLQ